MSEISPEIRAKIEDLIEKLKNEKGKLDCGTAFKIAAKLGCDVGAVGQTASDIGVRIDACELGQFGKLPLEFGSALTYRDLKGKLDERGRIFCADAREAALGAGL